MLIAGIAAFWALVIVLNHLVHVFSAVSLAAQ